LNAARRYNGDVTYADTLMDAMRMATDKAGTTGTVVIAAAQPIVGEAMQRWGYSFEQI
jgi:hypothetical protein